MAETASKVSLNAGWQKVSTDGWSWAALQNVSPDKQPIQWCRADSLPDGDFDAGFLLEWGEVHNCTAVTGQSIYAKPTRGGGSPTLIVDGGA